jgi:hypothetical protein
MSDASKGEYLAPEWQRIYNQAMLQYQDKDYLGAVLSLKKIPQEFRGNPDVTELMKKIQSRIGKINLK